MHAVPEGGVHFNFSRKFGPNFFLWPGGARASSAAPGYAYDFQTATANDIYYYLSRAELNMGLLFDVA